MWRKKERGEREVTRAIHRLFWQANFVCKRDVLLTYCMRVPGFAIFNILVPLIIAFGLQAIVDNRPADVKRYVYYIIWSAVLYSILWGMSGIIISRAGATSASWLQQKVFKNYLQKDYDFYTNAYSGSLGAQAVRLRDSFIEYNMIMMVAVPKQIVIVVAGIGVLAYQSLLLAGITFVAMGAVLAFTIIFSSWRLRYRRKVSELGNDVAGLVGDTLSQSHAVKSFAAEAFESDRLHVALKPWAAAQYMSWFSSVPSDIGRALLAFLATAALLVVTAKLYQNGDISIAIVALVQLYVVRLIASTLEIAEIIKNYEHVMGGAYQPVKTMFVKPTIIDKPNAHAIRNNKQLSVAFSNVSYHYPDMAEDDQAVTNFSLHVKPGEKIGLVGYSGSGKTTLTKLLLRFMDINSGSIAVDGIDVQNIKQQSLRKQIAYVPQEPLLFHRSVFENIAYGQPNVTNQEVRQAAKMAYIDDFIQDLPNGYDTLVGERGVKLSGGQRQRVAIARAILKNSPILVLDEATSALDSQSERYIQEALQNLLKNRTALVIAHRLSTIQRMDRIVVMDKGIVVQTGTHAELLKDKKGIYAQLWAHQSGGYLLGNEDADD